MSRERRVVTERRGGPPRAVGGMVAGLTRTAFGKRGFAGGDILADWPMIVGATLAGMIAPEKVAYDREGNGTLHLRAASGAAAAEIQHLEPRVIERVNAFYGFRAIARLRIIQGPLPKRKGPPVPLPPLPKEAEEAIDASVAAIADPELRESLRGLGRMIASRSRKKRGL